MNFKIEKRAWRKAPFFVYIIDMLKKRFYIMYIH